MEENEIRARLLGIYRGYPDKHLFQSFPRDMNWELVELSKEDIKRILYIKDDYWVKLSKETRLASVAAENIRNGVEIYNQSNKQFYEAAEFLKKGGVLPKMIIVSEGKGKKTVVLEGHLRLTAYMLDEELIPDQLQAIIGYSEGILNWGLY